MTLPIYELVINPEENNDAEVSYIALVDAPAIKKDFLAFNENFIEPTKGERKDDFLPRCISYVVGEGKEPDQAVAICNSLWEQHFAGAKVSFDYDDTLSTDRGKEAAKREIDAGNTVYIISARGSKDEMLGTASDLGIPESRVYATGSNEAKIAKVKELGIDKHYDNNSDVIAALGPVGHQFAESYNDYPEAAKEAAKTALRYAEENGWGDCGTPVGKARANQLAKGEAITRETIARMAAFDRHRENSDKPLGDGCGRLMWLAWGGDAGIEWAQRKLKQIDREKQQQAFAIQNEDERIITGPLMVPEQLIYRNNERFGEHYVKFTTETIRQIAIKFAKKGYQKNVNLMHDSEMQPKDVTMFESFISDSSRGIKPMEAFNDLPDGTWFGSFYVENPEVWKLVKEGQVRGFSVEGLFDYETPESLEEKYSKLVINELAEIFKHF